MQTSTENAALEAEILQHLEQKTYETMGELDRAMAEKHGISQSAAGALRRDVGKRRLETSPGVVTDRATKLAGPAESSEEPRIDPEKVDPPEPSESGYIAPKLRLEAQPARLDPITIKEGKGDRVTLKIPVVLSFEDGGDQGYQHLPMPTEQLQSGLVESRKLEEGAKNTTEHRLKRSWPTLNVFFSLEDDELGTGQVEAEAQISGSFTVEPS